VQHEPVSKVLNTQRASKLKMSAVRASVKNLSATEVVIDMQFPDDPKIGTELWVALLDVFGHHGQRLPNLDKHARLSCSMPAGAATNIRLECLAKGVEVWWARV